MAVPITADESLKVPTIANEETPLPSQLPTLTVGQTTITKAIDPLAQLLVDAICYQAYHEKIFRNPPDSTPDRLTR